MTSARHCFYALSLAWTLVMSAVPGAVGQDRSELEESIRIANEFKKSAMLASNFYREFFEWYRDQGWVDDWSQSDKQTLDDAIQSLEFLASRASDGRYDRIVSGEVFLLSSYNFRLRSANRPKLTQEEFDEHLDVAFAKYDQLVLSPEQHWKSIESVMKKLLGTGESGERLLASCVAADIQRHSLARALQFPPLRVLLALDENEASKAISVLAKDHRSECQQRTNAQIRDCFEGLLVVLSPQQIEQLEGYCGLTKDDIWKLYVGCSIDSFAEMQRVSGYRKLRKEEKSRYSKAVWSHLETIEKTLDRDNSFIRMEVTPRHVVTSPASRLRPTKELAQYFQGQHVLGWGIMPTTRMVAHASTLDFTQQQGIELKEVHRNWGLGNARAKTVHEAISNNNQRLEALSKVILEDQAPTYFLASVAWNGGLTCFMLKPEVIDDFKLSRMQVQAINELRTSSVANLQSEANSQKALAVRRMTECFDQESSVRFINHLSTGYLSRESLELFATSCFASQIGRSELALKYYPYRYHNKTPKIPTLFDEVLSRELGLE